MKKVEFVKELAQKVDMTQTEVQTVLTALDEIVLDVIAKEDYVRFGFGTISGVTKAARTARNPKTGELIEVPEKHGQPKFKASKKAKE